MTPGGVQIDPLWRTALWQQFGAAKAVGRNEDAF